MSSSRKAIVIGTGAGGLAAAAYLAKDGFEVLALERSDHPGGFLAPFSRDGFLFDPGVHYIGGCRPGGMVHDLLAGLGLDAGALFCELDPDGFDVYRFPGLEVRMCRPIEAYRDRLISLFPAEAAGLKHFFDIALGVEAVQDAALHLMGGRPALRDVASLAELPTLIRWLPHTLSELLDECIEDERLKSVLAAQGGDYGLPPSLAAAVAAILVLMHYRDGAFFPRGGSGALRDALIGAAERHGARFRLGASVARVLVEQRRARGVELEGGERIEADVVVSDVDPTITLGRLVDPAELPAGLRRKVAQSVPSLPMFTIYLGLRRDLRQHGLGAFNLWLYPVWAQDADYSDFMAGRIPERPGLFVSPNSLKDDTGSHAPPGCTTLEISTFVPFSMFERWQGTPPGERGPEYAELKERIAATMLRELERQCPGLVGDVVVKEYATPLTAIDYVGVVQGSPYGPAVTPAQFGIHGFHTRTPVANLLLAGAGVYGGGVGPCFASGFAAARAARRAAG